jgi:hypothetical protein
MELGKFLYLDLLNCRNRKYLHLDTQVLKKSLLFAPRGKSMVLSPVGIDVWPNFGN